jgi:hypothetical protein
VIRRALAVAFASALAAPARAEPPAVFELSVTRAEGAGSCPSGNELERRVSARLGRVPFTSRAEQAIEATLSRRDDTWRAEIRLRDADGIIRGERQIDANGQDCEALAEAATLAIALTIDPDAPLTAPARASGVAESLTPPAAPATTAAEDCSATPCPVPPPCPEPRCAPPVAPPTIAAALRAALSGGLIPGPAPGVALSTEAGLERIRGTLGVLFLPETDASDPRFAFGLTTAALGACGFPLVTELEFGLCAELQLGAIHAVVRDLQPLDPGDQVWLALAGGPRLRLHGPGPVFFEAGGSAVVPLLDRSFDVEGLAEPVFRTAVVGGIGFLGVGLRVP